MFLNIIGYEICLILLIPIFIIFYMVQKLRGTLVKYKISSFVILYLFGTLVFVFTIFPFVHIHGFPPMGHTYLSPIGRIADELSMMSYTGGIKSFILDNIKYFGSSFIIYFLVGFSVSIIFKKKMAYIVLCGTSLGLQIWYIIWGLAMGGLNIYKSVSTETVILFIAFGAAGIWLHHILVRFSEKHLEDSNILNWLYHVFTVYKKDVEEDKDIGGDKSLELHSDN
jgi:hypothetical protein